MEETQVRNLSMILVKPDFLLIKILGCLNVDKSPFTWVRLECKSEAPLARVYHSASLCVSGSATGMVVVFGGRSGD
jgi:hypothetical protein